MKKTLLLTLILFIPKNAFADIVDDTFNFNNTDIGGLSSPATCDDSRSMVVNPGGIGLRPDGEGFFSSSVFSPSKQLNLFGTYNSFNAGLQQFTPKGNNIPNLRKYYAGAGYPIFQGLSFGVSYSNVQALDGSNITASSIDVGMLLRPMEFLSTGFVIKNFNTPFLGKIQINRSYLLSLGFRPASWDRFSFIVDSEWVESSPFKRARGSVGLETEFINGVHINAHLASDFTFKNIAFDLQGGIAIPFLSGGYSKIFDSTSRDAGYVKVTLNKSRNLFQSGEESDDY